jgi:DNA-binding NarL/FixJ family response regulator
VTAPRVLIADDHQAIRVGVRDALEAGGCEVVAEADTAYLAVDLARRVEPDACLLDIAMPGGGLWALREILRASPSVRCVMLTISDSAEDLMEALDAGASGYLLKDVPPDLVPQAIHLALQGESVLSHQLTARVVDAMRTGSGRLDHVTSATGRAVTFTPRQAEVLELLLSGATTAEIASRLFVRQITVRRHIADVMHMLHVNSRAEVVALLHGQRANPRAGRRGGGDTRERSDDPNV